MAESRVFVCATCIEDEPLQDYVRNTATSEKCDYCQDEGGEPIACHIDEISDHMREFIEQEYNDPAEELPYESAEGGYQGDVLNIYELFDEIGFGVDNSELLDDLAAQFQDEPFCKRDYFGLSPSERKEVAWKHFKQVVMHHRRYTFWSNLEDPDRRYEIDHIPAGFTLSEIASAISIVAPVQYVDPGKHFWRVRVHDHSVTLTDPTELTSPPIKFANQPNRMSPAGISMFYGADDFPTAVIETITPGETGGQAATGAKFVNLHSLNLLDLTRIPRARSFFEPGGRDYWHAAGFLESFAFDLSKAIKHDGRQHIEYVPTQVFTEYVRFEMKTPNDEPFHGIVYKSSRNQLPCYVLFADQKDCLTSEVNPDKPQMLSFVIGSIQRQDNL